MEKRSELYTIQEPEPPVEREILCLTGTYSLGPAKTRPVVGPPWPQHVAWRDFLRRTKQKTGV